MPGVPVSDARAGCTSAGESSAAIRTRQPIQGRRRSITSHPLHDDPAYGRSPGEAVSGLSAATHGEQPITFVVAGWTSRHQGWMGKMGWQVISMRSFAKSAMSEANGPVNAGAPDEQRLSVGCFGR